MKNDPHVTEVSDDGALLKRYRNEIVDLKRRLHEASVITLFFFFSSVMLCLAYHCKFHYSSATDLWMTSLQVSSVTQTTATEKEVLSQLLQEKDQLQREQEDRIRNLTELLVTSSNQVPVQKVNVTQREAVVRVQLSLHYHSRMTLVLFLRCQNAGLRGEERCSDLPVRLPVMVVHLTSALQNLSFGRGKQTVPV